MGESDVRMTGLWRRIRWVLLGVLVVGCLAALRANVDSSAQRAEDTLRDSLMERYPGVAFSLGAAQYDAQTRCYVVAFTADGFAEPFTAYVRGDGVTDNYEAVALYDDEQSAEFSAQCRLLAEGALADALVDYDVVMASVQVPRGKYGADMAYNPALVDEKVSFRVYHYAWSGDEAAFSKWCNEVQYALLLMKFPLERVDCIACEPAEEGYGAPIFEMTL